MTAAPAVPSLGRASRAVRLALSLALVGGAAAFALLHSPAQAKRAPLPVTTAASDVSVLSRPSTRVPGSLVLPKRKKKVVKQAAVTNAASTANTQAVTPVVNAAPVVAAKPKASSSSGSSSGSAHGTEFGPG